MQLAAEGAADCDEDVPAWQGTQLIPESEKVLGRQEVQFPFEEKPRPGPQPFGFALVQVSPNQLGGHVQAIAIGFTRHVPPF